MITQILIKVDRSETIPLPRIDNDPTLCAMKYSIDSFFIVHLFVSKGIKDIMLTSIIIQMIGHDLDEIAPKTPRTTPVHIEPI